MVLSCHYHGIFMVWHDIIMVLALVGYTDLIEAFVYGHINFILQRSQNLII